MIEELFNKTPSGHIPPESVNIEIMKDVLEKTSAGFCLAKFTQVTLHLGTGLLHSCHHPRPHKISISEIEKNPHALVNTSQLQTIRTEMKHGLKPAECDYCWRVEKNNGTSDRYLKSIEKWALKEYDNIVNASDDDMFFPTYLEVDFSNVCNFKCLYCGPEYSSQWADDLRRNGPVKVLESTKNVQWVQGYQLDLDQLTYKHREVNPYVVAFWKWFPEAYKHLSVYRITGGEPLLSDETFKSIDWFIEHPNPNIEFNINTNLGVPDKIWNMFLEKIKILVDNKCVKRFTVFTSVDAWGERAEYIRPGLNFKLFKDRYEQLLQLGNVRVTTTCTFNILSISSIKQLLEWQLYLKRKYNPSNSCVQLEKTSKFNIASIGDSFERRELKNPDHLAIVGIDITYLRHPTLLDATNITTDFVDKYLLPAINFMADNTPIPIWTYHQGFEGYELEKFKRVCVDIMTTIKSEHAKINRAKFFDYINEMDKRNGTSFIKTFPEMEFFYNQCKQERSNIIASDAT